jgi:DNA polymerase-4
MPLEDLALNFGRAGLYYYNIIRGEDDRLVTPNQPRKSLGREITLQTDILDLPGMLDILRDLSEELEEMLKEESLAGKTVTLKLKYADFTSITRQRSVDHYVGGKEEIFSLAAELMKKTEAGKRPARLLGVAVSGFPQPAEEEEDSGPVQLTLPF